MHWKFYNTLHHSTCNIHFFSTACLFRSYQNFRKYFKSLLVHWEQLVLTNSCWTSLMLFVTAECPAWSVACFDGDGCVSTASLCDGRVQCRDRSDELLCAAKKGIHHTEMTTCITTGQSDNITELCTIFYTLIFFALVIQRCVISCNWMYILFAKDILRTDPLLFNSWVEEERCSL